MSNAVLATGDFEEGLLESLIPIPGIAKFLKGIIKCLAMGIFCIRQGTVNVKN